jgi:hypothetical protein
MNIKKIIILLPAFFLLFGCSEDDDVITQEETELQSVTHEVILFEFTPDTGNNSSRLQYEIRFTNPNDIAINGFHKITLKTTANGFSIVSSNITSDSSPCYLIDANSSCDIIFDEEQSFDAGMITSIELVAVEYNFEN